MAIAILSVVTWVTAASPSSAAQEPATRSPADSEQSDTGKYELPEAEFVASPSFRSASLVQKIWGHIGFEGDYFGGNENNIGYTAGSWTFRGKGWELGPGFGVTFGDNGFRTMPALSIRWSYERRWFITEGLLVQGLLHTKFLPEGTEPEGGQSASESVVPSIADGNHISARWKRLTAGGTWEHMQFREGREWKGGVRLAYRVLPPLSFTFFAMGPGSEIRGGILFQPVEKK
jgi:hypothetical protein